VSGATDPRVARESELAGLLDESRRLNAELEARIAVRTAELESAHQELEAYDYSISHDLRGPLNRIEGFSAALLEDHSGQLDEAGRDHLERVARAARQLGQMVSDILRLSNWNRIEMHRSRVDVSAMAQAALRALEAGDPGRRMECVVQPGMVTDADAGLLRAALDNLIGNAWKFNGRREGARIEVGSAVQGGERVYWVRDNGCGFDPLEARDLFKPFRRLASSGDLPGTGVGLAEVQRIVRRHGGRLWAKGAPGEGATMSFTLGERA